MRETKAKVVNGRDTEAILKSLGLTSRDDTTKSCSLVLNAMKEKLAMFLDGLAAG